MTVLAAVSLRLIISVYRLLPLRKNSWCPLRPRCPAPSPARMRVGTHQAAPCPDPSPRQPPTEVATAQCRQQRHRLELNAGFILKFIFSNSCSPAMALVQSYQFTPIPIPKPALLLPKCVQVPSCPCRWDGSGRDTGTPQRGVPQAVHGSTATSGGDGEAAAALQVVNDPWNSINPTQHLPRYASLKWKVPALPMFTYFGVLHSF